MIERSYSELIQIPSYGERLDYLKLLDNNALSPRKMSMQFYKSKKWLAVRDYVIDRDMGFDLGVFGVYIDGDIIVHHINPITESDIVYQSKKLLDPDNLITTSTKTHNLIHYNNVEKGTWVERKPGDTIMW